MTKIEYPIGGSLNTNAPTYVIRKADNQLYEALKALVLQGIYIIK